MVHFPFPLNALFKEKIGMNILDAYQPQDVEYIIDAEKGKRILTERHGALPQEENNTENDRIK